MLMMMDNIRTIMVVIMVAMRTMAMMTMAMMTMAMMMMAMMAMMAMAMQETFAKRALPTPH